MEEGFFRSMGIDSDAPVLVQYLGNNDRLLALLLKALAGNSEIVLSIVERDESSDSVTVVSTESVQLPTLSEGLEKWPVLRGKVASLIEERSKILLEVVMKTDIILACQI